MESKHLKVPWLAQTAGDCIEIHGYKRVVAVVRGVDDEAVDISRLIAAAPDLLAALEGARTTLLNIDPARLKMHERRHRTEAIHHAEQALAKAKGG